MDDRWTALEHALLTLDGPRRESERARSVRIAEFRLLGFSRREAAILTDCDVDPLDARALLRLGCDRGAVLALLV